ncbi:RYamide receptor-like [Mytilus californianus]|uniref:RYamide receptor-like n=1 Tax=Mytilus californianus TaxID=6549 RepID=UPI0022457C40|nr:RYamide receptor-like [Mytilus californianus]
MYDLPLSFIVPLLLLYGIVAVISFGGNIAVCYTLCNGKVLLTVTNFFLASLSVSDILMTVLCIPTTIVSDIIYKHWVLGSRGICIELWDDQQLQHIYSIILLLLQYFMPLLIMICVYVHIGYIIWIKPTPDENNQANQN